MIEEPHRLNDSEPGPGRDLPPGGGFHPPPCTADSATMPESPAKCVAPPVTKSVPKPAIDLLFAQYCAAPAGSAQAAAHLRQLIPEIKNTAYWLLKDFEAPMVANGRAISGDFTEDVLQLLTIRVERAITQGRVDRSRGLAAYVYTSARRAAISYRRHLLRQSGPIYVRENTLADQWHGNIEPLAARYGTFVASFLGELEDGEDGELEAGAGRIAAARLREFLKRHTHESDVQTFLAHELEGIPYKTLAAQLGVNGFTLGTRMHRLKKRIAEYLLSRP